MGIPGVRRISVRRGFYFKEVAMSRLIQGSSIVRTGAMVVSALLLFTGESALAGTTHRSIMDFIDAEGQVSFRPSRHSAGCRCARLRRLHRHQTKPGNLRRLRRPGRQGPARRLRHHLQRRRHRIRRQRPGSKSTSSSTPTTPSCGSFPSTSAAPPTSSAKIRCSSVHAPRMCSLAQPHTRQFNFNP